VLRQERIYVFQVGSTFGYMPLLGVTDTVSYVVRSYLKTDPNRSSITAILDFQYDPKNALFHGCFC